jgi:hypothetical protein
MNYAAKQLKSAQSKLAKLNKAIEAAAAAAKYDATEQEKAGLIEFDEEIALWNEKKELVAFIEHLELFVNKQNLQLV